MCKCTHSLEGDAREEAASTDGPSGLYQELEPESMNEEEYEALNKRNSTSKA